MDLARSKPQKKDSFDFLLDGQIRYENVEVMPLEIIALPQDKNYNDDHVKDLLKQALKAIKAGALPDAIAIYEKIYKKHSKDSDIGNMIAALYLKERDFIQARKILRNILKTDPRNIAALCNLASCHIHEFDYSKKVEKMLMTALEASPQTAELHHNAGVFYHRQTRIEDAMRGYRNAKLIRPLPETLCGLGMISTFVGKTDEARDFFSQALQANPNMHQPYLCFAELEMNEEPQNVERAMHYISRAVNLAPQDYTTMSYFNYLCAMVTHCDFDSSLVQAIIHSLRYKYTRHQYLFRLWRTLITKSNAFPTFNLLLDDPKRNLTDEQWDLLYKEINNEAFFLGVQQLIQVDLTFENALLRIRNHLLNTTERVDQWPEKFVYAVAENCFYGEYVWNETPEETQAVTNIIQAIEKAHENGNQAKLIALVGSYYPLYQTQIADDALALLKDYDDPRYANLICMQIQEPREEQRLKKTIKTIGSIQNKTSLAVKDQYEHNPYPRWKHDVYVRDVEKRLREKASAKHKKSVLMAGCGTGKEGIQAKIITFPFAKFTCVDLSSSSIAYAMRKTKELGLSKDMDYFMGDILELRSLNKQFDRINCSGVLHHMKDPMAGWRVITDLLKPGGEMYIGLYSELARQAVKDSRDYIQENNIPPTLAGIREFREHAKSLPEDHPLHNICTGHRDFYTTSMCRDLVFHVQEHRFTIPQIKQCLEELNLEFGGFNFKEAYASRKLADFPEMRDEMDLDVWHEFEKENPVTFRAMYQFICRKKADF